MNPEAKTPDNAKPETQIPNLTVVPSDAANSEPCPLSPEMLAAAMPQKKRSKPKGKIAELPKAQRDLVNSMLDDGATYKTIEEEMAKLGVSLNGENISNWFNGPYQDYVRQCEWCAEMRLLRESATDLGELSDGHQFQETLIQVALTDIFRALRDPQTKTDPLNHIRLFNALARLNREALGLRKYNDLRAQQTAAQLQTAAGPPGPDETRDIMFHAFERALGIKGAPGPIGPDLNEYMAKAKAQRQAAANPGSAGVPAGVGVTVSAPVAEFATFNLQPATSEPETAPERATATPAEIGVQPVTTAPQAPEPATFDLQPATSAPPMDPVIHQSNNPVPEKCYNCSTTLPPLLPNGQRPSNACGGCQIRLFPPGTTFDSCPTCQLRQPILTTGERFSEECEHCHQKLPPPGQRFVTECPACGVHLRNFTADGRNISERCPDCRTVLPLLEPVPPPSPEPATATAAEPPGIAA